MKIVFNEKYLINIKTIMFYMICVSFFTPLTTHAKVPVILKKLYTYSSRVYKPAKQVIQKTKTSLSNAQHNITAYVIHKIDQRVHNQIRKIAIQTGQQIRLSLKDPLYGVPAPQLPQNPMPQRPILPVIDRLIENATGQNLNHQLQRLPKAVANQVRTQLTSFLINQLLDSHFAHWALEEQIERALLATYGYSKEKINHMLQASPVSRLKEEPLLQGIAHLQSKSADRTARQEPDSALITALEQETTQIPTARSETITFKDVKQYYEDQVVVYINQNIHEQVADGITNAVKSLSDQKFSPILKRLSNFGNRQIINIATLGLSFAIAKGARKLTAYLEKTAENKGRLLGEQVYQFLGRSEAIVAIEQGISPLHRAAVRYGRFSILTAPAAMDRLSAAHFESRPAPTLSRWAQQFVPTCLPKICRTTYQGAQNCSRIAKSYLAKHVGRITHSAKTYCQAFKTQVQHQIIRTYYAQRPTGHEDSCRFFTDGFTPRDPHLLQRRRSSLVLGDDLSALQHETAPLPDNGQTLAAREERIDGMSDQVRDDWAETELREARHDQQRALGISH